ncbi:MAG: hypothetical protein EBS29_00275 [Chloroflexia bacterium]|nr:hypothetical protein [Chloroflexia bacterium]
MTDPRIARQVDAIIQRANQAPPIFLYKTIQVGVDSVLAGVQNTFTSFALGATQVAGLNGWQVVGVVPKTLAITANQGFNHFVSNGGNVIAVYLLMQLTLTKENASLLRHEIEDYVKSDLQAKLS